MKEQYADMEIDVRILDYCVISIQDTAYLVASIASMPIRTHLCRVEFWPFNYSCR